MSNKAGPNYKAPARTSTFRDGGHFSTESAGVEVGLSKREALDVEAGGRMDNDRAGQPGYSRTVQAPIKGTSVSSKGKSFEIL
jgi:hypothetical protein